MNIFEFMSNHPILTLLLAYLVLATISEVFGRFFRAITINKHGYPPAHCDADGDFKKEPERDDD